MLLLLQSINPIIAKKMQEDRGREYMNARRVAKEYEVVTKGLIKNAASVPPQNTPDEVKQVIIILHTQLITFTAAFFPCACLLVLLVVYVFIEPPSPELLQLEPGRVKRSYGVVWGRFLQAVFPFLLSQRCQKAPKENPNTDYSQGNSGS